MDNDIIKLVRKFNVITVMYSAGIVIWAASIELYLQSIGYTIAAIMLFNSFFWIFKWHQKEKLFDVVNQNRNRKNNATKYE